MESNLTIETKVWEKDWELIMKTPYISKIFLNKLIENNELNNVSILRFLYLNNISDMKPVIKEANKLIDRGIIDKYFIVKDYEKEALKFFNLNHNKLGKGYVYSIAELVSIYLCQTKYLLHFSGDSFVKKQNNFKWLKEGINLLEKNKEVAVFNLTWNNKYNEANKESILSDGKFYYGYGFSDQMYLIRTAEFKKQIYEFTHVESNRYPVYGGELFEKRVDSYMRNNRRLRATYKYESYIHKNINKSNIVKKVLLSLNKVIYNNE